jgi:hypothetical protein
MYSIQLNMSKLGFRVPKKRGLWQEKLGAHCKTDCQHFNFYGSSAKPSGAVKERQEEKTPLALSGGLSALC